MPNEGFYEETLDGRMMPERIMYMNVRPSSEDSVNGVLYLVSGKEIQIFDRREWTYDRIAVDWIASDLEPQCGKAFMYVAKPEWRLVPGRPKAWAAVRKTYLDIISEGVASLEDSFRQKYEESTDSLSPDLILIDKSPDVLDPAWTDLSGT